MVRLQAFHLYGRVNHFCARAYIYNVAFVNVKFLANRKREANMNHVEDRRIIVPRTIVLLTRDQAGLFRHVEAEFGRPDPFDDAGDDPDPFSETLLVDLDDLRQNNPSGARWLEQRDYPRVAGSRVTPYAGDDRQWFAEKLPEGTWNGYWDEKAYALVSLPPSVVQASLEKR
jgi:hypothetical protein